MDNDNLLMIILAFAVGYCLQGMMKNMCGGRLFEGSGGLDGPCSIVENPNTWACESDSDCTGHRKCGFNMGLGTCFGESKCPPPK